MSASITMFMVPLEKQDQDKPFSSPSVSIGPFPNEVLAARHLQENDYEMKKWGRWCKSFKDCHLVAIVLPMGEAVADIEVVLTT